MSATTSPARSKPRRKINWTPYFFLIGPLLIYLVWIIGPMFYTFYLSLTNWDGISPELTYVGLKNFESLFSSLGKTIPSAFQYSLYSPEHSGRFVLIDTERRSQPVFKLKIEYNHG